MPTLKQLSHEVQRAFAFLAVFGFHLATETFSGGDSYRDGFWLTYVRGDTECRIDYTDMEFNATVAGVVIFGPGRHLQFSGNMFSREHLLACLPRLSEVVNNELSIQFDSAA